MSREAQQIFFVGENGTGKSTAMIHFLPVNQRNLVFPASGLDTAWDPFPKIKPQRVIVDDTKTRPGFEKKKYVYRLPGINTFTGTRVVDMSGIETDEDVIDLFMHVISEKGGFLKGGLFVDDFRTYVKSDGLLPHKVKKLLIGYRHRELDLFFACHSFNNINKLFFGHKPRFYIFKTDAPPSHEQLKNYYRSEELMQVYEYVQAHPSRHFAAKFPSN